MNRSKPNHWLFDSITQDEYNRVFQIADERLVYDSLHNYCKIEEFRSQNFENENSIIKNYIDMFELIVIEWSNSDPSSNQLKEIYQSLFYLIKVLPIPTNDISKIKHIYKLISYSYLGEKWESGRRYIIENISSIGVDADSSKGWDISVFMKTYMAFLFLVRKNNWDDLTTACDYIRSLREEQLEYEKDYLSRVEEVQLKGRAFELVSLYHYAKAIDLVAHFLVHGELREVRESISLHFDKAIEASEQTFNVEMTLLLQIIYKAVMQIISNSIWMVTQRVNSRVTKFVNSITKSGKPIYELLYPQKHAILESGLLDPAHRAVVVNMPTSSGKTLLAEFRILQALNQFSEENGWVVYIAPTRALVNQVTLRLKRDFHPIGIIVEKMSGAVELDSFEENLLTYESKKFDVLVTTPEKFNLLVRDNIEEKLHRPLALAVIDEAHNIEDINRGLSLELLMANIKNDCSRVNFLLLTPFIPNSEQLARWLDPDSPNSIKLQLSWTPNDRVLGAFYPVGNARKWMNYFETMQTSHEHIKIEKQMLIDDNTPLDIARSKLTKTDITAGVAKQLINRKGMLVVCRGPKLCWDCAKTIAEDLPLIADEDIELAKRFIVSELGENFALVSLLSKGIGVHHAGLPDEVKYLMEWLMENEKLRALVATTTIAQGINFPVSTVLMASYSYPWTSEMPNRDFWNLVGRAGRTEQSSLGLIGIAVGDDETEKENELSKLREYISRSTKDLISNLVEMVNSATIVGNELDLSGQYYKPEWSQFMQYITHMFNQCKQLDEFNTKAELFLRRTYGYNLLTPSNKRVLLDSVVKYGEKLNQNKGLAKLSDSTGFSMEAINIAMYRVKELGLKQESWHMSNLFSGKGVLKNLMGIMLSIPEIKKPLEEISGSSVIDGEKLAQITIDWVDGKDIGYLAQTYFNGTDETSITKCCTAIYSKLINSATWGLSSIQKIPNSGLDFDSLSENQKKEISNLPAMIYYGVNTDEAILMRMNQVPRSIAEEFGKKYKATVEDIYKSTSSVVSEWINKLPQDEWNDIVGSDKAASGRDYSEVWKILNGQK